MTRYLIEMGCYSLDVTTKADDDEMDGTFTARCNDTGEMLRINGWLMESCERID